MAKWLKRTNEHFAICFFNMLGRPDEKVFCDLCQLVSVWGDVAHWVKNATKNKCHWMSMWRQLNHTLREGLQWMETPEWSQKILTWTGYQSPAEEMTLDHNCSDISGSFPRLKSLTQSLISVTGQDLYRNTTTWTRSVLRHNLHWWQLHLLSVTLSLKQYNQSKTVLSVFLSNDRAGYLIAAALTNRIQGSRYNQFSVSLD